MRIINNLFKTGLDRFLAQLHPSNFFFFLKSFSLCQKFPIHEFVRSNALWKLFDSSFPYKHCFFKTCLPTRQNGVENRDKAYSSAPKIIKVSSPESRSKFLHFVTVCVGTKRMIFKPFIQPSRTICDTYRKSCCNRIYLSNKYTKSQFKSQPLREAVLLTPFRKHLL